MLLYLAVIFGVEWFLARREKAWPGLVLPVLHTAVRFHRGQSYLELRASDLPAE